MPSIKAAAAAAVAAAAAAAARLSCKMLANHDSKTATAASSPPTEPEPASLLDLPLPALVRLCSLSGRRTKAALRLVCRQLRAELDAAHSDDGPLVMGPYAGMLQPAGLATRFPAASEARLVMRNDPEGCCLLPDLEEQLQLSKVHPSQTHLLIRKSQAIEREITDQLALLDDGAWPALRRVSDATPSAALVRVLLRATPRLEHLQVRSLNFDPRLGNYEPVPETADGAAEVVAALAAAAGTLRSLDWLGGFGCAGAGGGHGAAAALASALGRLTNLRSLTLNAVHHASDAAAPLCAALPRLTGLTKLVLQVGCVAAVLLC